MRTWKLATRQSASWTTPKRWEEEMRQKLRKGVQYLTNEKDTIRLENLDATTLSAIILNKKANANLCII